MSLNVISSVCRMPLALLESVSSPYTNFSDTWEFRPKMGFMSTTVYTTQDLVDYITREKNYNFGVSTHVFKRFVWGLKIPFEVVGDTPKSSR